MDTNSRRETDLLDEYLKGNLSGDEESKLFDWINSSEGNYLAFKEYIHENQFAQKHSEETLRAWQQLSKKLSRQNLPAAEKKIIIPGWLKVAAIVVVALLSGFFATRLVRTDHYANMLNEIIVQKGKMAQVVLSDGTTVYLNAGTRLEYPGVFSESERKVTIAGEAFFNVAKDKLHPFIVETPKFKVKVTGTSFNLSAYKEDKVSSLTLNTGEVTIVTENQKYKIKPGEKYSFNAQTMESEITNADLQKSFLWREGLTVIDDLNLEEIRKLLERKFDVHIDITNKRYEAIKYTGQFKSHENLEDILDLIRKTSPVKFNYNINATKDTITIE